MKKCLSFILAALVVAPVLTVSAESSDSFAGESNDSSIALNAPGHGGMSIAKKHKKHKRKHKKHAVNQGVQIEN